MSESQILLGTELDFIDLTDHVRAGTFSVALPTVSMSLDIVAASVSDAQYVINDINRYLSQAKESSRPHGYGKRIELRFQLVNGTWAYCDVTDGVLVVPAETLDGVHLLESAAYMEGVGLALSCLPLGRLDPIDTTVSATLTHGGLSNAYVIQDVPGDAPALMELIVQDVSTGTAYINRMRVAIRSGRAIGTGDYTFIRDAVSVSPAVSAAEGNTVGGTRSRITVATGSQRIAEATIPERGLLEVIGRVRDSSAEGAGGVVSWGVNAGPVPNGTGTLVAGTYRFVVAALNGANIIAISESRSIALAGLASSDAVSLSWTAVTGSTDYRVYYKLDATAYAYKLVGSATASYILTATAGGTTGNPPTEVSAAVQYASILPILSVEGLVVYYTQPAVSAALGNNSWEDVTLFRGILPLTTRSEYRADRTTLMTVNAKSPNGESLPTVDVDAFYVLPLDGYGCEVEFPGLTLADRRYWRMETNRYGEFSAYLVTVADAVVGTLDVLSGSLYVEPYPSVNLVYVLPSIGGGVSDVTDAKYTVSAKITPRWRTLGAAVP